MGKHRDRSPSSSSGSDSDSSSSTSSRERRRRKEKKQRKKEKKEKASPLDKLKKKLVAMKRANKEVKGKQGVECLTADDFFVKQAEFGLWLKEHKHTVEEMQGSDESRLYFCKFALRYNEGRLSDKYYRSMHATDLAPSCRTSFKWGFVNKLDEDTVMKLGAARDSTDTNTFSKSWEAISGKGGKKGGKGAKGGKGGKGGDDECSGCRGAWPCTYAPHPQPATTHNQFSTQHTRPHSNQSCHKYRPPRENRDRDRDYDRGGDRGGDRYQRDRPSRDTGYGGGGGGSSAVRETAATSYSGEVGAGFLDD